MPKIHKRVLVVGGAGYIGGALTDLLIKDGIPFTVYDNLLYEPHYLKPVDFIFGDVREKAKLKALLPNYTHVVYLAAIVGEGAANIVPAETRAINDESVKWLVKNFKGRIIFTSTCSVYGDQEIKSDGDMIDETAAPKPISLYGETKVAAEKYLSAHPDALILRLGTLFGVGDAYSRLRLDLAVNRMTAAGTKHGKLQVFGGAQWRPFIHVRNVAEAILLGLKGNMTGIYNIAAINTRLGDMANIVAEITGCSIEKSPNAVDRRNYNVRVDKAKRAGLLNFKKVIILKDGIKELAGLVKKSNIKDIDHPLYTNEKFIALLVKQNLF